MTSQEQSANEFHGAHDVGGLGDEAAKLAEALQLWAQQRLAPLAEGFGGSEECQFCPVCRAMALVRGERPEVLHHLSAAVGSLAAALAAALAPAEQPAPGDTVGRESAEEQVRTAYGRAV